MRLVVAIFVLAAAGTLGADPVTGRVSDPSNLPLAGATVVLQLVSRPAEPVIVKTDKSGIYEIKEVPDGVYSIEASKKGYVSVRYHPIRIRYPHGYEQDFELPLDEVYSGHEPGMAHLAGELRLADKPVAGVRLCLSRRRHQSCSLTNRFGQYSMEVAPGDYQARVYHQHDLVWRQSVRLPSPGEYRNLIQIRLVAGFDNSPTRSKQ